MSFFTKPRALNQRAGFSLGLENLWIMRQNLGEKAFFFHNYQQFLQRISLPVGNSPSFPQALPLIAQDLGLNRIQTGLRNPLCFNTLQGHFRLSPQSVVVYTTKTNS